MAEHITKNIMKICSKGMTKFERKLINVVVLLFQEVDIFLSTFHGMY